MVWGLRERIGVRVLGWEIDHENINHASGIPKVSMRVNDDFPFSNHQKECFLKIGFFYRLVRPRLI
jgi:hypothetical protein